MVKNAYPLPLISTLIDKLKGAKYFSKMDIQWEYNNICIKEGDEWKAAFTTPFGLYKPLVMFFGQCNSPPTFQAFMDSTFGDMIAVAHALPAMVVFFLFLFMPLFATFLLTVYVALCKPGCAVSAADTSSV